MSGVVGTVIGADIFRLEEVLAFDPPSDGVSVLSIGGANIFDMVYMTGIIAVVIAMVVIRAKKREEMYGFGLVVAEHHRGAEGLPYAKDKEPSPTLYPQQRRDQQNGGK